MQCRVSLALHPARRPEIIRGAGGVAYSSTEAPTFFVGVYSPVDLAAIQGHVGRALVMFCGGDARRAVRETAHVRETSHVRETVHVLNALDRPRVHVVAARSLAPTLERRGLRLDLVRDLYVGDPAPFRPCPPGPAVFVGMPYPRRLEYGLELVRSVAAQLPDIPFLLSRWGAAPSPFANAVPGRQWQDTNGIRADYEQTFCQVRCHRGDGFSTGLCESALMGRPVCHVLATGVSWISTCSTVEEIVELVVLARGRAPDLELAAAARAHVEDRSLFEELLA